uniref:hypothetical protein n=1 Tax=Pantoea sp. IMH TaxID=1267600 RepID=UPI000468141D|nr:hypothetical protein [Pantoea sp. IMH]
MIFRFALAAVTAAMLLTGCAPKQATQVSPDFFNGPTRVNISHLVTQADDGSAVMLTVDGNEAGALARGESTELRLPPGEHKLGGYVPTLFGIGRVTIQPIEITTSPTEVTHVAYSVTRDKPVFEKRAPSQDERS